MGYKWILNHGSDSSNPSPCLGCGDVSGLGSPAWPSVAAAPGGNKNAPERRMIRFETMKYGDRSNTCLVPYNIWGITIHSAAILRYPRVLTHSHYTKIKE